MHFGVESAEEKEAKRLFDALRGWSSPPELVGCDQRIKVFWFFSSEKNCFLPYLMPAMRPGKIRRRQAARLQLLRQCGFKALQPLGVLRFGARYQNRLGIAGA
jgi:hypothetical protein